MPTNRRETVHLGPGTDAWLDWRETVRSASEAPIIMGAAPAYWERNSWADLRNPNPPKEPSDYTREIWAYGHRREEEYRRAHHPHLMAVNLQRGDYGRIPGHCRPRPSVRRADLVGSEIARQSDIEDMGGCGGRANSGRHPGRARSCLVAARSPGLCRRRRTLLFGGHRPAGRRPNRSPDPGHGANGRLADTAGRMGGPSAKV